MATITTTSLGELLKRLYAPWDIDQLVNLTYPVLNEVAPKGSASLGGEGFRFAVRTESAEGHAYIAEDSDLPTEQQSVVNQATVVPTVHIGVVKLTGLSVAVSSRDAMAFARGFDENIQQTIEAMTAYKEGALFRTGTGLLGTAAGAPSGDSVTMDDVSFFREGMRITVFDASTSATTDTWLHAAAAPLIVEAVDWPTRTVTFTATPSATIASGDKFYIAAPWQATGTEPDLAATTFEPVGFEGSMLSSGTYLGISRDGANANWRANQLAAGGPFDEDILLRARTRVTQESGIPINTMANRFKVVCHPSQAAELFKLAIPRINYQGGGQFDLGNSQNVKFGGITFSTSYLAPDDKAYMGDFMYHKSFYTPNGELHIDSEYNGASLKWVPTKDIGLVFAKEYHAFALRKPNCFIRITGLTQATR